MTSALTAEAIAELKRLDAEATAGPWHVDEDWTCEIHGPPNANGTLIGKIIYPYNATDARLAVALRNAATALLSELEQSRVALEAIAQRCNETGAGEMAWIDTIHAVHAIAVNTSRARQRTQTGG